MEEELNAFGIYEIIGVVFAIISVGLAIKEKRLTWVAAILSSLAYIPTFFAAKLYTETVLQGFFIVISWIGWCNWRKAGNKKLLEINTLSWRVHFKMCFSCLILTILLGTVLKLYSNASFPYADSAVTIFSILTSFLQARKILECWTYWILIDAGATYIYISKGLLLTAGLYGLYLVLASLGYIEWRKIKK